MILSEYAHDVGAKLCGFHNQRDRAAVEALLRDYQMKFLSKTISISSRAERSGQMLRIISSRPDRHSRSKPTVRSMH